jgi:hypothetical protein
LTMTTARYRSMARSCSPSSSYKLASIVWAGVPARRRQRSVNSESALAVVPLRPVVP